MSAQREIAGAMESALANGWQMEGPLGNHDAHFVNATRRVWWCGPGSDLNRPPWRSCKLTEFTKPAWQRAYQDYPSLRAALELPEVSHV